MFMIIPNALYAFLISIFGSAFPCQDIIQPLRYNTPAQEMRYDKNLLVAQPMELIDGGYASKK